MRALAGSLPRQQKCHNVSRTYGLQCAGLLYVQSKTSVRQDRQAGQNSGLTGNDNAVHMFPAFTRDNQRMRQRGFIDNSELPAR